jgi:hypothetical protein
VRNFFNFKDLRKYIERLVDFVDGTSDDPLEKNNLK